MGRVADINWSGNPVHFLGDFSTVGSLRGELTPEELEHLFEALIPADVVLALRDNGQRRCGTCQKASAQLKRLAATRNDSLAKHRLMRH